MVSKSCILVRWFSFQQALHTLWTAQHLSMTGYVVLMLTGQVDITKIFPGYVVLVKVKLSYQRHPKKCQRNIKHDTDY